MRINPIFQKSDLPQISAPHSFYFNFFFFFLIVFDIKKNVIKFQNDNLKKTLISTWRQDPPPLLRNLGRSWNTPKMGLGYFFFFFHELKKKYKSNKIFLKEFNIFDLIWPRIHIFDVDAKFDLKIRSKKKKKEVSTLDI